MIGINSPPLLMMMVFDVGDITIRGWDLACRWWWCVDDGGVQVMVFDGVVIVGD